LPTVLALLRTARGEEVEAITEVDVEGIAGTVLGSARPAVRRREVLDERRYRADEATAVAGGAVARRMRALPEVLLAGVIHGRRIAAVGRMRTRAADGVHHPLQDVAPLVAAGHGDTTQVTLSGILELVGARRAQRISHGALHKPVGQQIEAEGELNGSTNQRRRRRYTWKMGGFSGRKQTPQFSTSSSTTVRSWTIAGADDEETFWTPPTTTKLNTLEGQKPSRKPLKPPRKSILAASTQGMAAKDRETRKYYFLECRPPQINSLRVKPSRK